jgi:superfamily I DNA/RNA helicase
VVWDQGLDKAGVAYKIASSKARRIRVIAGPGTGKSYAMKRRVARLLEEEVPPEKVLAVTFTRVAAEDLHRELQKLDVPGCEDLEGVTLHGLAMRILARQHVLNSLGRTPRPLHQYLLELHQDRRYGEDRRPLRGERREDRRRRNVRLQDRRERRPAQANVGREHGLVHRIHGGRLLVMI